MEKKSMTALVSAFARAYHAEHNTVTIFNDSVAKLLLSEQEYSQIAQSMSDGISFFAPHFVGSADDGLRFIVDHQLSPSPLARAAYAEKALKDAVIAGTKQYLILAAGYDTFAYRQPEWAKELHIFEIDHPATAADKQGRISNAEIAVPHNVCYLSADFSKEQWQSNILSCVEFDREKSCFCSLLGLSYYLSEPMFRVFIATIGELIPVGSQLVFDYSDHNNEADTQTQKQTELAAGANEAMLASYDKQEMEQLLQQCGFIALESLTPAEITNRFFLHYNAANPEHPMSAFDHVNYCVAIKTRQSVSWNI
ncbi:MAG: methyltransferase, putative, family [Caproiciproducens sp.]|nr:methyltransferase, putative, family [Caproiciproducens sp.]